jgi:hypothetical protein
MPTIRRRKHRPRGKLCPYKTYELLTGDISYVIDGSYAGYGDGHSRNVADFVSNDMRRDWAEHRDELLSFWRTGKPVEIDPSEPWLMVVRKPDRLPWAAIHLDGRPPP